MPEGTSASVWASAAPSTKEKEPAPKESKESGAPNSNPRGRGGKNPRGRRGGGGPGRRQSTANTTTDAPSQPAPSTDAPPAAPRQKLIDRLSMPPEAPASPTAQPSAGTTPKTDSPDSKSQANRRNGGRGGKAGPKRRGPPAKVNTAAAQKELEKENAKEEADPEPTPAPGPEKETEQPKDDPPHINAPDDTSAALTPNVNGLADRLKALNPSVPSTPRPFTPSAIDWAGDTEDGSLPDLDDWGVQAKSSSPTDDSKAQNKPEYKPAPHSVETKPNGRQTRRKDSKAGKNLTVPNRNTANVNGNASSRPGTPSSTGFASPSLRGKQLPPRAGSRASTLNDAPPQITVTAQEKPATSGLGLDLSVEEPVFASINDPLPEPSPELNAIKPVRAPNAHPNNRGARGRGGRPRMSDGNAQPQPGPNTGFGMPMQMHMPPSPRMPPSPHLPPSPYLPGAQLPPNGYHPGYNPGPHAGYPQPHSSGYPQPHSSGFVNSGPPYGHQHSYSHPQRSPHPSQHHHSPRHQHHHPNESPRHQRSHSRPIIAGSALNMLGKALQGSSTPPKPKTDVSASS